MSVFVEHNCNLYEYKTDGNWVLINPMEIKIKSKIEQRGVKLENWDIKINYGVKTGLNDAFIINEKTRKELILSDPKSAEIIRPILRGRDIDRYSYTNCNLYLLFTHNGLKDGTIKPIDINDYPAVKKHLDQYRLKLEKRYDQGCTFYNLRSCDYMEDFFKPKIMYSEIVQKPQFYLDNTSIIPEASTFILVGENLKYLCIMLNSRTISFLFKKFFAGGGLGGNGYRYKKRFLLNLPIVIPNSKILDIFNEFYDNKKYIFDDELNKLEDLIMDLYEFDFEEKNYIKTNF